ncbi:MAG: NTP transferase domain-containing protein [candidate division Zixibacteria bacterium]|nr:NTP transferase domain-containing protein [candidate division Zixibacteria bacterium]
MIHMPKSYSIPSAIVLAAGEGSRIGKPKAILEINGRFFIERVIDTLILAGIDNITVVLGAEADKIKSMTDLSIVNTVINENYTNGQFSSLQAGLSNLKAEGDLIVFPVDHPLVEPDTVMQLLDSATEPSNTKAVVPVFNGKKGHPVLLTKSMVRKVQKAANGETLRDILWNHPSAVKQIGVDDPGILQNIDTVEDYQGLILKASEN